jgi:hypothetical protein
MTWNKERIELLISALPSEAPYDSWHPDLFSGIDQEHLNGLFDQRLILMQLYA